MAKYIKPESFVNADTPFYSLPLVNDGFELTVKNLDRHYLTLPKSRKNFKGVWASFISFKREVAIFRVTIPGEVPHFLYMHISVGEMEVYCNCGMPGDLLCKHAYYGLRNLMFNLDEYKFENYYWPGYTREVSGRNKFLKINPNKTFHTIQPVKSYGNLFKPGVGFEKGDTIDIEIQPKRNLPQGRKCNELVLGYCLVYTYSRMAYYLPVLIPYLGVTDKSGSKIAQFKEFITEETIPANINFTDSQLLLNDICFELLSVAKSMSHLNEDDYERRRVLKNRQLELWHQALDGGIALQEFVHSFATFGFKSIKGKPIKGLMKECYISVSLPVVSFILKDKGDHFTLHAVLNNGNKEIHLKPNKVPLFVTNENDTIYYALATVQDDNLLNWLSEYDNCLTVLKVHFTQFHEQFLKKLSACYPVYVQMNKAKEKVLYDFGALAAMLHQ